MSIEPQGEEIRRAVKWVSEQRTENPRTKLQDLIACACMKFDLSPKDEDFLLRFLKQERLKAKD